MANRGRRLSGHRTRVAVALTLPSLALLALTGPLAASVEADGPKTISSQPAPAEAGAARLGVEPGSLDDEHGEVEGSAQADDGAEAGGGGKAEGSGEAASRPSIPTTGEHPPAPRIFETPPDLGVLIVEIDGEITPGMAAFVQRAVDETLVDAGDRSSGRAVDVLVVDIDTFGGRIDSAVMIRDALLGVDVPVVAYVHNRAISAGALITYAADHIVFSPAASMGAATPIQLQGGEAVPVGEKVTSYMRAEMRATAEAHGRRADLAEGMVDRVVAIEGVVDGETLLTITTGEAVALEIADGVSESLGDLLNDIGAGASPRKTLKRNWAEQLAMFITNPAIAGLLMSLGILGVWIELKAPGFGAPGVIGLLCLSAFFFGHMVVQLAGWEEVILMIAGMALIAVEIFVIPGFGVAGVLGILCFLTAFVLALIGLPLGLSYELGTLNDAAFRVTISLLVVVVGMVALAKLVPSHALPGWLVLRTAIDDESGAESHIHGAVEPQTIVGALGVAATDLRPAGKAKVGARLLDVVGRTDWIDKGTRIKVIEVAGVRIVVDVIETPQGPVGSETKEA